jgi:CRP-like cAMP-binding protein
MKTQSNKLIEYFSRIMPLSSEETRAIQASMVIKTFPKGEVLLHEGHISTEAYFVLEGCIRQYSVVDGEEKTSNFFTEGQWALSLQSFSQKIPARHSFVCAEETTVVVGTEQRENDLYKQFPRFETISRKVMETVLAEQQERMASYIADTPEQRYMKLIESRPDIFQRVPQYQIASYIGVQPESLSRIRKRIAEKTNG